LISEGADINIDTSNMDGHTALQAAARNGHLDIVKLLVTKGADINAKGSEDYDKTALQAAARNGHIEIVNI
jgi:ankyrin repeat protein